MQRFIPLLVAPTFLFAGCGPCGDSKDVFMVVVAPFISLGALFAALIAVIWLICRFFGVTPQKKGHDTDKKQPPHTTETKDAK
jgi:hypothetical protein